MELGIQVYLYSGLPHSHSYFLSEMGFGDVLFFRCVRVIVWFQFIIWKLFVHFVIELFDQVTKFIFGEVRFSFEEKLEVKCPVDFR